MTTDDKKTIDLTSKREKQITHDDVTALANELCAVLSNYAETVPPAEQLLAIELTARSALETFRQAFGEEALNAIIVDVNHRAQSYQLEWKSENQAEVKADSTPAEVVPLRSDDEGDD